VPVGKTIAMLAEEGDDISDVEVPAEENKSPAPPKESSDKSASSSTSKEPPPPPRESKETKSDEKSSASKHAPHTSKPMMPSVMRLLTESNVSDKDAESIKGTGVRGMLTKGDVLVFLGKAKGPTGTFKADNRGVSALGGPPSSGKGGDQAKKSAVSSIESMHNIGADIFSASL
jgi:pyruvate/2-oxoglutarate dehydrogenase complex dihydrolipoamide acyltransferase (E2) component